MLVGLSGGSILVPMKLAPLAVTGLVFVPVRARPRRLSALSVFHSKSVLYGGFVRARRALNSPN